MALLGGGPRRRSTRSVTQIIKSRKRARELKIAGPLPSGAVKPLIKAGGSLLRRFAKKIPFVKKFIPGSAQRIVKAEARLRAVGQFSGGARTTSKFGNLARRAQVVRGGGGTTAVVRAGAKLVVAGAALEGGSRALQAIIPSPVITVKPQDVIRAGADILLGGKPVAHPGIGSGGGGLELGGHAPPGSTIVKVWDTGTARFARDASGMHYVLKKDGTIKRFRPPRPVCIPKKWDSRSMSRVMRRLESHRKAAIKLVQMLGGTATKTRHAHRG